MQIRNNPISKYPLLFGFIISFLYESPFILLGEDSHLYISDNLDALVPGFLVMVNTRQVFDFHSHIIPLMNGIPREFLANGVNISVFWYFFFKPFCAYIVNDFFVHWIAFVGMYSLLKNYLIKADDSSTHLVVLLTSIVWTCIPFFSIYGISIAGQPLLYFAFLNLINNKKKLISFLTILLFPFYSMLVFAGAFIIPLFGIYFLWLLIIKKEFKFYFLSGIVLLTFTYVFTEYQLIELILFQKDLISHRTAWNPWYGSTGLKDTIAIAITNFFGGHFHAKSIHSLILFSSLSILGLNLFTRKDNNYNKKTIIILLSLLIINILFGLCNWTGIAPLKEKISLLKTFQINRFIWLTPFLWYLLFAYLLISVFKLKAGKIILTIIFCIQLAFALLHHSEIQYWTKGLVYKKTGATISYREFFSEELFHEIKSFIGKAPSNYRIINLGIHPAIAQYSGFYTLDSYQNNYLLSYKNEFRPIIAGELAKSKEWREYFDFWGNRCYLFSSELPKGDEAYLLYKWKNTRINNLAFNVSSFKKLGGRYIFSAAEIKNSNSNGLNLLKTFERIDSPWRIYIYEAK